MTSAEWGLRQDYFDQADRLAITTDVMLVLGVATVGAAALLYALRTRPVQAEREPDGSDGDSGVEVSAATDGRGAWVAVRGSL